MRVYLYACESVYILFVVFCVDLACSVKMPHFWTDSHILCYLIGASLGELHTYGTAVQNPPDIYIYIYVPLVRPASNLVPRWAPLSAQRANVGLASNDSKVNNIALKTATLVSRFS